MTIPAAIRAAIKERLWAHADRLSWESLGPSEKARQYEVWTRDPEIGGQLARFIDPAKVRVYIKDTLLKDYTRSVMADASRPLRILGISPECGASEVFIKPHGRLLEDGRIICWGRADDWKMILMAMHERAFASKATPGGIVLFQASARYHTAAERRVAEDAAKKLGVGRLVWME